MLNHESLVELYRKVRQEKVLSVYLDGRATDFAERNVWRKRLDQALAEARSGLDGNAEETAAFARAEKAIDAALSTFPNFLPGQGWVGFATAEGLVHGDATRVPMPDLVRWENGIRVAPYVRALKQERLVVAALVDSRRARIFEYRGGELTEPENLAAEAFTGDASDTNQSKRPSAHSGQRGATATDSTQRVLDVLEERLHKQLAHQLADRAGKDALLVLGGPTEAVAHMRNHLSLALLERTAEASALRVEMGLPELKTIVEGEASKLTQALQQKALDAVIDQARSGGRGALGAEPVRQALKESRVDTLFLSRGFIRANPEYADHLVGAAFEQHAEVEELSFDGAQRLDTEGEGVAARLRYTV